MDFMLLNTGDPAPVDFDARSEIVSKDIFFRRAGKYISTDRNILLHRQSLFSDILEVTGLSEFLKILSEKLTEYEPLMKYAQVSDEEEKLHSLLYPTVYIELVKFIYESLSPLKNRITAKSLQHLYTLAQNDMESDEYKRAERYYKKHADRLRSVNSVTVGVNLNALYRPTEAGIISFHQETFKSGDLMDRIFRLDFKRDEYHCIAPITNIDKKLGFQENQQVNYAFLKALEKVINHGLQHCNNRVLHDLRARLAKYFEYWDSLTFVVEAMRRLETFREKNIPLCFPKISTNREISVVSLYDNSLCYAKDKKDIVPNTITLKNNVCCHILTGPNSGGKTVFLNSLAAAQYYFQLGMPIPAKEATLPICDAIFKISAEEQTNVHLVGRFEKECISLSEVLKNFTPNSLALIDEAFSATAAVEAVPIAANFISKLCQIGGKCVFVTHHHELCETEPTISVCGAKIGYLHTESHGDQRTYAVHSGKAECGNYAQSIARKYGLIKE